MKRVSSLPRDLAGVLWSYDLRQLDPWHDRRRIIINTINYGTWPQWRWLARAYGVEELRTTVQSSTAGEFRPGALKLISLLIGATPSYAPRGTH